MVVLSKLIIVITKSKYTCGFPPIFNKSFIYSCGNSFANRSHLKNFSNSTFSKHFKFSTMPPQNVREDWSFKTKPDLIKRANELVKNSRKVYDSIAAVPDKDVTYETVLKVIADDYCTFSSTQLFLEFPQHTSPDPALRDASAEAEKIIQSFLIEARMRQDVFKKLQILESKKLPLKPEAKRYLDRLITIGKRNGLNLSKDVQQEVKAIKSQIEDLVIQYSKNLNEVNTTLEFSKAELDGMPEDFLENLKRNPDTDKYVATIKYPDYIPIMKMCRVPETRRKMEFAFNSQCVEENHPLLEEVVKLRHKVANLLGYPNHASYAVELLMAKSAENVKNFLSKLQNRLAPLWVEEKQYLLELKEKECNELGIPYDGKLNAYDLAYYTNKVEEVKYSVDQVKLKDYFPMPLVTERLLSLYQNLLGVKFAEVTNPDIWHEDVRMFSVTDVVSSELLGYFYLDLFPRPGKYNHAAMFELQFGCLLPDGTRQPAVAGMVANFTQSKSDKPSLMNHDEVTTFFHEFGHVMHFICAQADYAIFSGTNVERDFVEAPSQMLENWCWERESLQYLSAHYIDQSAIPEDLLTNLIESRLANTGYSNLRQIILALYDFNIHSSDKCHVKDTYFDLSKEIVGISPTEGTHFGCHFGHIMKEYDAQYYSYLWSEVFSLDMFESRFKKGNKTLSAEVGMDYRRKILQPGGSKDATEMLQDFLGRPPTEDAFLRNKGLKV